MAFCKPFGSAESTIKNSSTGNILSAEFSCSLWLITWKAAHCKHCPSLTGSRVTLQAFTGVLQLSFLSPCRFAVICVKK